MVDIAGPVHPMLAQLDEEISHLETAINRTYANLQKSGSTSQRMNLQRRLTSQQRQLADLQRKRSKIRNV